MMFFIESVLVSQSCVTLCDPMIFPTQGSNPGFRHCCLFWMSRPEGLLVSWVLTAQSATVQQCAVLTGPYNPGRLAGQGCYYQAHPVDEKTDAKRYSMSCLKLHQDLSQRRPGRSCFQSLLTWRTALWALQCSNWGNASRVKDFEAQILPRNGSHFVRSRAGSLEGAHKIWGRWSLDQGLSLLPLA